MKNILLFSKTQELATLSSGVNGSIPAPITNSTIPPSISPNATPAAPIAPNKEGGQAMTKSKSSESLNSLTKETDGTGMAMGNGWEMKHFGNSKNMLKFKILKYNFTNTSW